MFISLSFHQGQINSIDGKTSFDTFDTFGDGETFSQSNSFALARQDKGRFPLPVHPQIRMKLL